MTGFGNRSFPGRGSVLECVQRQLPLWSRVLRAPRASLCPDHAWNPALPARRLERAVSPLHNAAERAKAAADAARTPRRSRATGRFRSRLPSWTQPLPGLRSSASPRRAHLDTAPKARRRCSDGWDARDREWHPRIHGSTLAQPIRNVDSWMPTPFPGRGSARMRPSAAIPHV